MLALYRTIPPHSEGFTGVTGFNVNWMGFEVWAGSPADVCGTQTTGAPPNGYALPPAGSPGGLVYMIQMLPPDSDYFDAYGPWGSPGLEFPVAAYAETPMSTPTDFQVTGAVTLEMEVEEWKEIAIDSATPRVLLDYPTSGAGPDDDDFIGLSTLRYLEGPKAGGEWTFSIEIEGGNGSSSSGTIPAGMAGPNENAHLPLVRVFLAPSADEEIGCSLGPMTLNGDLVNFDLLDYDSSAIDAVGSFGGVILSAAPGGAGPYMAQCVCEPDTELAIDGLTTRLFEEDYGEDVDYRRSWAATPLLTGSDGVYVADETYTAQAVGVTQCDGGTATVLFADAALRPELFAWLDSDWMMAQGEVLQDWRIMIADDRAWTPFAIRHKASLTIDDFAFATGWVPSGGASLGVVSGMLEVTGGGGIRKEFDLDAREYRRLRLTVFATSGCRLTLNDSSLYYWDLPAGTATVDLCFPEGATALYDLTDSSHVAPGEYYGPQGISSVTLEDLDSASVYKFDALELLRTGDCRVTALPPFDEIIIGDDGVVRWRIAWGLSDKRQVFDMPYREEDEEEDRFLSVADFLDRIADAYEVSVNGEPSGPEADAYYYDHDRRLAAFMASEHYPDGVRTSLLDISIADPTEIIWLHRYDKVTVYPGIGDPAGEYGGAYPLRFTKRLQMTAHGLTRPGETVTLKLDAATEQTQTADEDGYFRFPPFQPLAGTWSVGTGASGDVTLPDGLTDRKYRWAGLAGEPQGATDTAASTDKTGRLYVAYRRGEDLFVRRLELTGGSSEFLAAQGAGEDFGIAWSAPHRVWLIHRIDGKVMLAESRDDAVTWEVQLVFASGEFPNIVADPATGLLYAFRHDGSGIGCKRSLDGAVTWEAEVVVVTCPGQQFGVTIRPDAAQTIFVSYRDADGAVQLVASRDNGLSWQ